MEPLSQSLKFHKQCQLPPAYEEPSKPTEEAPRVPNGGQARKKMWREQRIGQRSGNLLFYKAESYGPGSLDTTGLRYSLN